MWWQHWIPDSAWRASITSDSARNLAAAELRTQGLDPATAQVRSVSESQRPKRMDRRYTFAWPSARVVRGRDTLDVTAIVTVSGSELSYFISVPTVTGPSQRLLGSQTRRLLSVLSGLLMIAAVVWAGVVTMRRAASDTLQWAVASRLGAVAPATMLLAYAIPRMVRALLEDADRQRGLATALNSLMTDLPIIALMWIMATIGVLAAESLTYEKRPDLMFGLSEWSRGRFAIPEAIPAALKGYAWGLSTLAAGFVILAVGRKYFGAAVSAVPFQTFTFNSPIPALGVPYTTVAAVWMVVASTGLVALAMHFGLPSWSALAAFAVLGGAFRLDMLGATEIRVVVETLAFASIGWLASQRGALVAFVAATVTVGMPVVVDQLWAGGPFTTAGIVGVLVLLAPAAIAFVAYSRRPGGETATPT